MKTKFYENMNRRCDYFPCSVLITNSISIQPSILVFCFILFPPLILGYSFIVYCCLCLSCVVLSYDHKTERLLLLLSTTCGMVK